MLSVMLEDKADMFQVFIKAGAVHQVVVQVWEADSVSEACHAVLHAPLELRGCGAQAKGNVYPLIEPPGCDEGG